MKFLSLVIILFTLSVAEAGVFSKIKSFKSPALNEILKSSNNLISAFDKEEIYDDPESMLKQTDKYQVSRSSDQTTEEMLRQFLWKTATNNPMWKYWNMVPNLVDIMEVGRDLDDPRHLLYSYSFNSDTTFYYSWEEECKVAFNELLESVRKVLSTNSNIRFIYSSVAAENDSSDPDSFADLNSRGVIYYDMDTKEIYGFNVTRLEEY